MIKKILLGLLGLLLVGGLVFGAVNRTQALANYPHTGQRYGQQNVDAGVHRGWAEQEETTERGSGWYARGRGQHPAEEGRFDRGFGPLRRGQGRGAGPSWGGGDHLVPQN